MSLIHGFEIQRQQEIPEIQSSAVIYRHVKTGARLLSLKSDDENKSFGISFRTPPTDCTGVAHILEHSVLCGSKKYPVKEPFVELIKGSLQTFLNAMTYPDKTSYPVASANLQDFYNLVDVYLDAVFFPRLTPEVLMQEGWHYAVEAASDPLAYKGVVFNEMKGAYSSPDTLLIQYAQESLFPDTTYGLESGGHPANIPELTWEAFSAFHSNYYHPSNAWAFFSGDDPPERRLEILDAVFSQFEARTVESAVALQSAFPAPRQVERRYTTDDATTAKAMCTVNIVVGEVGDADLTLALHALEHILIGLPSSPLRRALVESGLGEDVAGIGLEDELRQLYFSTGLKGIDPANADRVEALILETLRRLVDSGVDPLDVEAAINSMEFALRENNTGSFPRGLALMFRALGTWLYDADPLMLLPFEAPLARLKARLAAGERVFEELLRGRFIENPHRTRLLLRPDAGLGEEWERDERSRLDAAREALDEPAVAAVVDKAAALREQQEAPDSAEDLATIPRLALSDLPQTNKEIPIEVRERNGVPLLLHDIATSGIFYVDLAFDLATLPDPLLPYATIFGRALLESGTASEDFVSLTQRIARKTGGIYPLVQISAARERPEPVSRLVLRAKATRDHAQDLLDILRDVLIEARLDDQDRLRQIVLEAKARGEERLAPAGHQLVATRLRARFGRAGYESELTGGVSQLFFLRQLVERIDADFDGVVADLEEIRHRLLNRGAALGNVTMDADAYAAVDASLGGLLDALPAGDGQLPARTSTAFVPREGLSLPAQVNYVGKGADVFAAGYAYTGATHVVSRYLSTTHLWERVRVQGGAYGAFCLFDRLAGSLCFVSYRDPNLADTLTAFDATADFLSGREIDAEELQKSVVGAIGEIDTYRLPDAKGYASMLRHLCGLDEDYLQQVREQVMACTPADFTAFADAARSVASGGDVVVLGGRDGLEGAGLDLAITQVL